MTPLKSNAPGPIAWVLNNGDFQNFATALRNAETVVMDLETTGLDEHAYSGGTSNRGVAARIVIASLTLPQKNSFGVWDGVDPTSWVVPLSHPKSPWLGQWRAFMRLIAQTMVDRNLPFSNHNIKFDARWIYACTGVNLAHLISWDTMIAFKLMDENASGKLKDRAPRLFGIEAWNDEMDFKAPGAAEKMDLWKLGYYAAQDTYWTWRCEVYQRRIFFQSHDTADLEPIDAEEIEGYTSGLIMQHVSVPTIRTLTQMEQNGIPLDDRWTRELLPELEAESDAAMQALIDRYDMPAAGASTASASKWFQTLIQKALDRDEMRVLQVKRDTGNATWDKNVLKKNARLGFVGAQMILDHRKPTKMAEFLRSWLEKQTPSGKIHANYNQGDVVTGRLSSSGPNMQQVTKALRPAFYAPDGYYFAEFDYSQLELRVAAIVSRSEPMLQAFRDGKDLHRIIAATIVNERSRHTSGASLILPEDVEAEDRQAGKAANFGLLYGQLVEGFRNYAEAVYGVEMTLAEAELVYNAFFKTWDGIKEWQERTKAFARSRGYVASPLGRIRHLPNAMGNNRWEVSEAERQALNSPIQGFGSDMMQTAAAWISGMLPKTEPVRGVELVGTVHDSLMALIPIEGWEESCAEVKRRMEQVDRWFKPMGVEIDIPVVADVSVGSRWNTWDILGE